MANRVMPVPHTRRYADDLSSSAPQAQMTRRGALVEIGESGVNRIGGIIQDEILPELRWPQRNRVIRQMLSNDATIGALLFAIEMLIRRVPWDWNAASKDTADQQAAEFVRECWGDMSHSWQDTVSNIVTFLPWGWSYHEIVYKIRGGPDNTDGAYRSKYSDGKIGWRKWPIRSQETLYSWVFDDTGGIQAMQQMSPPDFLLRTIPIDKALLFRTKPNRDSPEGWSILRNAYRPWRMKTRIENIEGIGVERDLAGLPIGWAPASYMNEDATADEIASVNMIEEIVKNIRADEQGAIVMPLEHDDKGNKRFDVTLMSTAGAKQFNTNDIITRQDHRILMTVMADFLMLGAIQHGSFALSSDKTDLFAVAIGAWLDGIAGVINTHAVPRLMRLNGMTAAAPYLTHEDIESEDIAEFADAVSKLVAADALHPDPGVETRVRKLLGLPALTETAAPEIAATERRSQRRVRAAARA